jgi:HD-like signal output (HDOD) protein
MNTETIELSIESQRIAQMLASLIEGKLIDVPMLPEVANKALILSQDPESDASAMAKLDQSDQSLAGHVMRIANSVAYTPLTNLVSLQQAVARLGMGIISEIALSASIGAKLFKTPGYEQHIAAQWQDEQLADAVYNNTTALAADDIANTILWLVNTPAHMNVTTMEIMPTQQATGPLAMYRGEN